MKKLSGDHAQQGAVLAEFAITFPLFVMVFLATIEFSRLMLAHELGAEVSRRAVRMASACDIDASQAASIAARLQPFIDASGVLQASSTAWLQLTYEPAGCNAENCRFVEARLVGLQPQLNVPGLATILSFPAYATRVPREAMASSPGGNANNAC